MKRTYLMTPGPAPVPSAVRETLSKEIMHHRTQAFRNILKDVDLGLKKVFCTNQPVLILAASGTGAMEAAVVNHFSTKDKVLVICGGKFGQRWADISKKYGLDIIEMPVKWGQAPCSKLIEKTLLENKEIKGVFTTLCETSTATAFDIEAIAKITKDKDTLLIVDAISGLGQDPLIMDNWGVDIVVSGSQKGLMLPPGLAFISLSEKAQSFMKTSNLPKYYFDLTKALKNHVKNDTPYTPAVSLIMGLKTSLDLILTQEITQRWQYFEKLALATREAMIALGLKIFSQNPSASVTAVYAPDGIKSTDIVKKMRSEYGVSIAAGQDDLKDKIFRIAHMGWINEQDLIMCVSLLEKVMLDLGYKIKLGTGVARLQEVIYG